MTLLSRYGRSFPDGPYSPKCLEKLSEKGVRATL
jgi:hypothetical protein